MIFVSVVVWSLIVIIMLVWFGIAAMGFYDLQGIDEIEDFLDLRATRKAAIETNSAKSKEWLDKDYTNISVVLWFTFCFLWIVALAAVIQISVWVYN